MSVACDVTRASDIDLLVSRTMERFGRVDILVNNAGTVAVKPIEEETEEEFDRVTDVNFTREVAAQWARRGIRVNAIAPGWFPSEMTGEMFTDDSSLNFIRRNTPMGRPGNPKELLGALIYLASDASSYTTGQTLIVDGGWTII